jgi:prepilin-type processing-associated H-X9-DG protein
MTHLLAAGGAVWGWGGPWGDGGGLSTEPGDPPLALTNYLANSGAIAINHDDIPEGWAGFHGPMESRKSESVVMPDGSSNVILYGENLGSINREEGWNTRWPLAMGGTAIGRPAAYTFFSERPEYGNIGNSDFAWYHGFASPHPGTCNFAYSDGSTHAVSIDISDVAMGRLSGAADGNVLLE